MRPCFPACARRPAIALVSPHRCARFRSPRSRSGCRASSPTQLRSLAGRRTRSPALAALAFRSSPSAQATLDVAVLLRLGSMTTTGTSTRSSMAAWRPAKAPPRSSSAQAVVAAAQAARRRPWRRSTAALRPRLGSTTLTGASTRPCMSRWRPAEAPPCSCPCRLSTSSRLVLGGR